LTVGIRPLQPVEDVRLERMAVRQGKMEKVVVVRRTRHAEAAHHRERRFAGTAMATTSFNPSGPKACARAARAASVA
jgi:hypothetical protein